MPPLLLVQTPGAQVTPSQQTPELQALLPSQRTLHRSAEHSMGASSQAALPTHSMMQEAPSHWIPLRSQASAPWHLISQEVAMLQSMPTFSQALAPVQSTTQSRPSGQMISPSQSGVVQVKVQLPSGPTSVQAAVLEEASPGSDPPSTGLALASAIPAASLTLTSSSELSR